MMDGDLTRYWTENKLYVAVMVQHVLWKLNINRVNVAYRTPSRYHYGAICFIVT